MPYVKRTTSTRRYPYYRRPAAKKRTRVYKRKPRGAPVKRKLATATKMLEQKYCPINRISEQAPAAIQAGAQVYALHALLGASVPPNWNGSLTVGVTFFTFFGTKWDPARECFLVFSGKDIRAFKY